MILWFVTMAGGAVLALFAPVLPGFEPSARWAYGIAIAGGLAVAGTGVGIATLRIDLPDGALPWFIGATVVPLGLGALVVLAVRDERRRGAPGWVSTAVLAAFPVFLALSVGVMLTGAR